MSGSSERQPQRDSAESPFSEALSVLAESCAGFRAAVFFDEEGETVDYHSFLDPFETRLVGAYHGVVLTSASARFRWLGLGAVERLEICAGWRDSISVSLGGGYYLTVVLEAGAADENLESAIETAVAALREEAGL